MVVCGIAIVWFFFRQSFVACLVYLASCPLMFIPNLLFALSFFFFILLAPSQDKFGRSSGKFACMAFVFGSRTSLGHNTCLESFLV